MISVCMATYNGEKVVLRQIHSVLSQLTSADELIIVDDGSSDSTITRIKSLNDLRVKLYQNTGVHGPIKAFELALSLSKGSLIFLCDQDDIWLQNKVSVALKDFQKYNCDVWTHDSMVLNSSMHEISDSWNLYNHNKFTGGNIGTILKNPYTGSMMAFTRKVMKLAVPFPEGITMHDQWIGMVAQKMRLSIYHNDEILMKYIRYGNNVTARRKKNYLTMLRSRLILGKIIRKYNK